MLKFVWGFIAKHHKAQRSVGDCAAWLIKMTSGGMVDHLNDIVAILDSAKARRDAGFYVLAPVKDKTQFAALGLESDIECEIVVEDEYADVYGQATLSPLTGRARRAMWMWAFSAAMYAGLKSEELMKQMIQEFLEQRVHTCVVLLLLWCWW